MTADTPNPPAFPYLETGDCGQREGMTLRDYFAAKASEDDIKYWQPMGVMVEKIRDSSNRKSIYHEAGMYTREQARYRFADAMLAARGGDK